MKTSHLAILLFVTLLAAFRPAIAEDTDLFVRANGSSLPPDVLFVIDNAANFSANSTEVCEILGTATALSGKVGGIEQCALYDTISALDPDVVNIGIMVYNASNVVDFQGVACVTIVASKPGGCLVYPMQLMSAPNKVTLLAWIRSWKVSGSGAGYIKANSEATGGSLQEAWAYYNGRIGLSGADYADTQPPTTCDKYIIFIGNSFNNSGSPGDQTGNAGPKGALEGANSTSRMNAFPAATLTERTIMNRTITTPSCGTATLGNPHENKGYYADEWSRYMYAHGISTYTIGVIGDGCQAGYVATLMNTAVQGGGKYFETRDTRELAAAIGEALSAMIARNSVFASVSLPVSVNAEGTYLNQVFIGMFRPDALAMPRWPGNLKQYRIGRPAGQTTGLELQDARTPARAAISIARTGFIDACALSYWTPTADDAYWADIAAPTCGSHPGPSNTPDGDVVKKGAQGYKLRGSPTAPTISRNIKTCDASCGTVPANFDTGNPAVTKTLLGDAAMTDQARADLIDWARGLNNNAEQSNILSTAMRPSAHGDVIHSRPVAINYGDDVSSQIVVFYGANDGVLRAINGNRSADIGSVAPGSDLWSFMPPEFYPQIKRLRDNSVSVAYYGNSAASQAPKPYGFDGAVTSDVVTGVGGHTWIVANMRRGGRSVYAFDVTNLTTDTASPTLKWKIGCSTPIGDDSGCVSGWEDMGQTWSTPKFIKTLGYGGGTSPMLIMGGGYGGACEDADPMTCTSASKGGRIYVLDADTGAKLKEFDISSLNGGRGVVADVFVVPDGNTGRAKWAYAVDLGGNVWRISGAPNQPFASTDPDDWTITRIATLGCDTVASSCSNMRKFMTTMDVVAVPQVVDPNGPFFLLFGSGDREKPLLNYTNAYGTTNYFFAVKDTPTDPDWLTGESDNCGGGNDLICKASLAEIDVATPEELAQAKGWYLGLNSHEQVVTSAITVYGNVTFSTHTPTVPDPDACDNDLGTARVYNVRYFDAAPRPGNNNRAAVIDGGGLPPSPVAGLVILDDGTQVPFLIGGSPESPLEGGEPVAPASTTAPKSITYWFINK
jgi:type IV pilus assembly protein PilY1